MIKEKVKIEPKMIHNKTEINNTDTSRYTPCGPWIFSADYFNRWQVVWRYSVYDLVVQHQPFNYQANVYTSVITGNFSIEITEGNDICEILELVPDPTIENGYTYHVVPDQLENVTLANAGGGIADSLLMYIQGIPSAHHTGFVRYTIHFTGTGDVTYNITENGETISYHTKVVEPDFYMDYDTVYVKHGEYAEVYYKPKPVDCQGMWDYWNGGYPGPNTLYNSNISGGEENIIFGLTNTDGNIGWLEYGSSFTNYDKKERSLLVWAEGKEPIDSTLTSTIHISSNKSVIPEVDIPVRVYHNNEYPLGIFFDPPVLAPGDTANIILMRRVEESGEFLEGEANYEPFPPDQEFEIFIEGGDGYALLYSTVQNVTGTEFTGTNSFKLIANEDVFNSELVTIKAYTTIIGEDIGIGVSSAGLSNRKLNKAKIKEKKNPNTIDFAFESNTTRDILGLGYVVVGDKSEEILLGQTKYFGVKKKGNKYKIAVTDTTFGVKPSWPTLTNGWEWVKKDDVWGTNPIEKLGTKSGVYWEKKWYNKTDNTNNNLPAGMIRLIGRYWEEGKEDSFKVKLKTTAAYNNTEVMVKVIEPGKLLTEGQSPTYAKARDVHNKEYSIDSLCIYWGGKIGIPPQMIKGQMLQESAKKDFGGSTGWGFAPSYRYEPYTTQFGDVVKGILKNDTIPFIVTKTEMGKPGAATVPTKTEHQHLEFQNKYGAFLHYFESPMTIWDVIEAKSRIVDINNIYTTYGFQYKGTPPDTLKKGQIKSGVYRIVTNTYTDYLKGKKIKGDKDGKRDGGYEKIIKEKYGLKVNENLSRDQQTEANDSARAALIRFFKKNIKTLLKQE